MRWLRCVVVFVALGIGAFLPAGLLSAVLAQDGTPTARLGEPDPAECTVAPRPMEFFAQFVGTPTSEQLAALAASAMATPIPDFQMPEGTPADAETVAAMLETVWQLGACVNASDFPRYAALFTEDYHARDVATYGPISAEQLAFLEATPRALPEEGRAALLAVVEVRELVDGRVAALIDMQDPYGQPPGPGRFYWEFVEDNGRWLIDEEVMLGPITPRQIGTPTA